MTLSKFKKLKVGDEVTLVVQQRAYGAGFPTSDGCAYIPKGSKGIVGAVDVPSVYQRKGTPSTFIYIDFPPDTLPLPNPHQNRYRCAVFHPEELE